MLEFDSGKAHAQFETLLFSSPFSHNRLAESSMQVPQKVPHSLLAELHQKGDSESLLWLCLPQMAHLWKTHRHVGINPEDLFGLCLLAVAEQIQKWQPEASNNLSHTDYLSRRIYTDGSRQIEAAIAREYGLKPCQYPLIDLYYRAQKRFKAEEGRQAGWDDLSQLKERIKELLEGANASEEAVLKKALEPLPDKDDAWHGNTLDMIHQHHCAQVAGKARHPLEAKPNYDASFLTDSLETAMAFLTPQERTILSLHYWDGLTQREIAGRVGITESRVYQILQRTLRKLRHPAKARFLRDWLL